VRASPNEPRNLLALNEQYRRATSAFYKSNGSAPFELEPLPKDWEPEITVAIETRTAA
jgi:hypothetical protein